MHARHTLCQFTINMHCCNAWQASAAASAERQELASGQAQLDALVAAYLGGRQTLEQAKSALAQVGQFTFPLLTRGMRKRLATLCALFLV